MSADRPPRTKISARSLLFVFLVFIRASSVRIFTEFNIRVSSCSTYETWTKTVPHIRLASRPAKPYAGTGHRTRRRLYAASVASKRIYSLCHTIRIDIEIKMDIISVSSGYSAEDWTAWIRYGLLYRYEIRVFPLRRQTYRIEHNHSAEWKDYANHHKWL